MLHHTYHRFLTRTRICLLLICCLSLRACLASPIVHPNPTQPHDHQRRYVQRDNEDSLDRRDPINFNTEPNPTHSDIQRRSAGHDEQDALAERVLRKRTVSAYDDHVEQLRAAFARQQHEQKQNSVGVPILRHRRRSLAPAQLPAHLARAPSADRPSASPEAPPTANPPTTGRAPAAGKRRPCGARRPPLQGQPAPTSDSHRHSSAGQARPDTDKHASALQAGSHSSHREKPELSPKDRSRDVAVASHISLVEAHHPLELARRQATAAASLDVSSPTGSAFPSAVPTVNSVGTPVPQTPQSANAASPGMYTPGWCGLHIRQTLDNTCMRFNHQACVYVSHVINLYDAAGQPLAPPQTARLAFDGINSMLITSKLPFALNVTQLGVVNGDALTGIDPGFINWWPVLLRYLDPRVDGSNQTWRNDDVPRCSRGKWDRYLVNRDFDCGFACPPPDPAHSGLQTQGLKP